MIFTLFHLLAVTETIYKSSTPFDWVTQHIQLIGWPLVVYLAYKIGVKVPPVVERVKKAEIHITKMASNELPHSQRALINIDRNIAKLADAPRANYDDLSDVPDSVEFEPDEDTEKDEKDQNEF